MPLADNEPQPQQPIEAQPNPDCAPASPGIEARPCRLLTSLACALFPALLAICNSAAPAQTAHFSNAQTAVVGGLSRPVGLALDASGNLYIANAGDGHLLKETLSGGAYSQSVVNNFNTGGALAGVAVDANGNVYATILSSVVKETPSAGGYTPSFVANQGPDAEGVAVDSNGNVYIAVTLSGLLLKETPEAGGYVQTTIESSTNFIPQGIAVDASGNLYIATGNIGDAADVGGSVLKETLTAGNYTQSVIAQPFVASAVAVDRSGNVYVTDYYTGQILKETPSAGGYKQSMVPTVGVDSAHGIAVDSSGNVYVTGVGNHVVFKESFSGGVFLSVNPGSISPVPVTMIFTFDQGGTSVTPSVTTLSTPGADFTDAETGTCNTNGPSHTYKAGDICTVDVQFTPSATGTRQGEVRLLNESDAVIAAGYVQGIGAGSNKPPLTVTLHGASRIYGAANPQFTYSVSGLAGSDTVTITPQTNATPTSGLGNYTIVATVSGADVSNYDLTVNDATLQVLPAVLHVVSEGVYSVYGNTPPQPTAYTFAGLLNGDTVSVASGAPVLSSNVTSTTPAGFYPINIQLGTLSAANYTFVNSSNGEGEVGVSKRPLLAIADNQTMTQGGPIPTLTYHFTGFVNGDTTATAVTGAPVMSTTATVNSPPGKYIISGTIGTLASQNYSFTRVTGTMTVLP